MISPGYYKSEDLFSKNSAPSRITISSGGSYCTIDMDYAAGNYSYAWYGYLFDLPEQVESNGTVRVSIDSARSGWLYEDTCISELHFLGVKDAASYDYGDEYYGYGYEDENNKAGKK
jgi:hypothetical protein